MDIKKGNFQPGISNRIEKGKVQTRRSGIPANMQDVVSIGESVEKLPQKPVFNSVVKVDGKEPSYVSGSKVTDVEKGVKIHSSQEDVIDFLPGEAAGIPEKNLSYKKEMQLVKPGSNFSQAVMDSGNNGELSTFYIAGQSTKPPRDNLAGFLSDAEKGGLKLVKPNGETIDANGAYNYLTKGWDQSGSKPGAVFLVSDGVYLVSVTSEKFKNQSGLNDELKKSWDALNDVSEEQRIIEETGKPVGDTPFHKRLEIFQEMETLENRRSYPAEAYRELIKERKSGESLDKVAEDYFPVRRALKKDSSYYEAFKILHYLKKQYPDKPAKKQAFLNFLNEVKDFKITKKAIKLIDKPVGNETAENRTKAMQLLMEAGGESCLDAYHEVVKFLKPGDDLLKASKDMAEYLKAYKGNNKAGAVAAYNYNKKKLSDKPVESKRFCELYMAMGSYNKARECLKTVNKMSKKSSDKTQADTLLKMMKAVDPDFAYKDFNLIRSRLNRGESFSDAARVYLDIAKILKGSSYSSMNTHIAFWYIRQDLQQDKTQSESFLNILKNTKDSDKARLAHRLIQKPLGNADYNAREKIACRLAPYTDFDKTYRVVMDLFGEKGDPAKAAGQLADIIKATDNKMTPSLACDDFRDMKYDTGDKQDVFDFIVEMTKALGKYYLTEDIYELVSEQIPGTTQKERMDAMQEIATSAPSRIENLKTEIIEDYKLVTKNHDKNRTLPDNVESFVMIQKGFGNEKTDEKARKVFQVISEGYSAGKYPGKSIKDVTIAMLTKLLVYKDIESAEASLLEQVKPGMESTGGKITKEEEYVVIGGVKLKKRK